MWPDRGQPAHHLDPDVAGGESEPDAGFMKTSMRGVRQMAASRILSNTRDNRGPKKALWYGTDVQVSHVYGNPIIKQKACMNQC